MLKRSWFYVLRLLSITFALFERGRCYLHASALTFYSLLSIVPMMATAFAIAKGFGFESSLEQQLRERFSDQKQVMEQTIEFSRRLLEDAQGGIIGGVGILVMLWSVIKMFSNIEESFNALWGIPRSRSLARRFADYLAVMLICPIVFMIASSINIFLIGYLESAAEAGVLISKVGPLILKLLKVIPFFLLWILFSFLYIFMPNKQVHPIGAFLAGLVTATLYQMVQWIYITFQIGVAQYGTIYGSFAALPLFLVWLQLSWVIVLGGAALCAAFEKAILYSENAVPEVSVIRNTVAQEESDKGPGVASDIIVSGPGFTVTITPRK